MQTAFKELTQQQMLRYARQIMLPNFDFEGQEALLASHVVVVGAGGLGCAVLPYLVAAGVGAVTVIDHDHIERSNLQRQILFREADLGAYKAEIAVQQLQQLNSECRIQALTVQLTEANISSILDKLAPISLVMDCTDQVGIRQLLNRYCYTKQYPFLSGAAIRMEGQVCFFPMQGEHPCYQCFSQFFGEQNLSCHEAGVLSPVVGVIGTLQAVEALKVLAKVGQSLASQVLFYDAAQAQFRNLKLTKQAACPVCR